MSTPRPAGSLGDELSNLGIGLLIACAILAGILRGAGSLAAWVTGTGQPDADHLFFGLALQVWQRERQVPGSPRP